MNKFTIIALFLILISFTKETMAQDDRKGQIKGKITNLKNNEPLPFVNIGLVGTKIGTSSNIDGEFVIENIPVGFYKITASSIGFKTKTSEEFQIVNSQTHYIEIKMHESSVSLQAVYITVNTLKRDEDAIVSMKTIGKQEIENSPGTNRDIAKVIQNLPGVANLPVANRNDIFIRGGAGNESRFYLDGVEIPNINHFATQGSTGGTNGILNADFLREVNFYSASFPASKANALSAVFDFKQIDGNKERIKYRTSIGASEISLIADGPIGNKTTFVASVRRSYLQLLFKLIKLPFLPTFNDYQVKFKHRINDKNEINLISIGALDFNRLYTDIKAPNESQQYILDYLPEQKQWNYALGVVWKHFYKNGYSTLVTSRNMLNNKSYKYINNNKAKGFREDYESSEIENKLRWENNLFLANDFDLLTGIDLQYVKSIGTNYIMSMDKYLNNLLDFGKYSAFAQMDKGFLEKKLRTSIGYRMSGNTYADYMYNPIKNSSLQTKVLFSFTSKISAHLHAGRFYQLPSYTALGYRDKNSLLINKNNKLGYINVDHYVVGIEVYPYQRGLVSIEGFYKQYHNYPFSLTDSISLAHRTVDFGVIGNEALVSSSKGEAWGFEVLSQNRFANNFNLLVSYTFSVSQFQDKHHKLKPTAWDNRHIFVVTASKRFKNYWDVGLKWRFAGGLPYSPFDLERSQQIYQWNMRNRAYLNYDQLMSKRFGSFHQLDIRINKSFFIKKTELKVYLDIQNLYNFKSDRADIYTNRDKNGNVMINPNNLEEYQLRTLKNKGSGTVLPTIGLIFDF